jgi:Protein of unknown function (DUF3500)
MATDWAGLLKPRERHSTPSRRPFPLPPRLQEQLECGKASLDEPLVGITADGTPEPGLFAIRPTGVSTAPIRAAAEAWLAALRPEQREAALFDVDSPMWRAWSNIHPYMIRHGVMFEEMTDAQRDLALALLQESLSAYGYQLARDIMKLNYVIGEITGRWDDYGEWCYWLSIFGTPAADAPWGWQIDGHHLIVNFFVLGDQVVMTPTFLGSEPVLAVGGKYEGTRVFEAEEANGLALMQALSPAQQRQALIGENAHNEAFTSAFRDNTRIPYQGIRYDALTPEQQALLVRLIETYVGHMRPGHAAVRMDEVKQHLPETYFAWMGGCADDSVFYYRVHSPVILIEFDHQLGLALDNDFPNRQHIHTVVRTPNGNDYGKDLLRQHYEQSPHHQPAATAPLTPQ